MVGRNCETWKLRIGRMRQDCALKRDARATRARTAEDIVSAGSGEGAECVDGGGGGDVAGAGNQKSVSSFSIQLAPNLPAGPCQGARLVSGLLIARRQRHE